MDSNAENQKRTSVETVFHAAMGVSSAEREAFLQSACGGDAVLLSRVQSLLRANEAPEGFLPEKVEGNPLLSGLPGPELSLPASEKPGDKIGRYKLLQSIGEGGCGVVYMAEQEEPVRRRVALKVIKLGMDTKQVVARFEAERQALALMDHANIAKVLDAGATENGRPFFVMELVRGVKITEYCDQSRLSTEERLELFVQVCRAIEHAHQKGIIHRDIKPSNVLVTLHDGVPVPKVIDFGIAKATQGRLTDHTLFTAFEQFIGTPAYMSPEQAELSGLDVDTRSDIYSLGVLLYELLTGRTPFDPKQLMASGLEVMRHTIREQEPARPSTMLSTMLAGELATAARHRRIEAPRLISSIRGDLEWIVMKCLDKDRARRYETASALASDVQRYMKNEAVLARPPSRIYAFQKLVRRHKLLFASAGAVSAAILVGLALSTFFWFKAAAAEKKMRDERSNAQAAALKSQTVASFFEEMLSGVGPSVARGRDTKVLSEILSNTVPNAQLRLKGQPDVEAQLLSTVGSVYLQLADFNQAESAFARALELRLQLHRTNHADVARAYANLGGALWQQGKVKEAESTQKIALEIREKLQPADELEVAQSLHELGQIKAWQGKLGDAYPYFSKALEIRQRWIHEDKAELAQSLSDVGEILSSEGKWQEAERLLNEALKMDRRLYPGAHPNIAFVLNSLAKLLLSHSKEMEAELMARQALQIRTNLYSQDHPLIADSEATLAQVLYAEQKLPEAEREAQKALEIQKKHLSSEHPGLADTLDVLIALHLPRHDEAEIENLFKELPIDLTASGARTTQVLKMRGNFRARTKHWKEAAADYAKLVETQPEDYENYHSLAPLLVHIGDTEGYLRLCNEIRSRFGSVTNDSSMADRLAKDCLILPLPGVDRTVESKLADVALARGIGTPGEPWFRLCKGLAEFRQNHADGAVEQIRKVLEVQGGNPYRTVEAYMVLVLALHDLGQDQNAREAWVKGVEATKDAPEEFGGSQHSYIDWIIGQSLMREAQEALAHPSGVEQSRQ